MGITAIRNALASFYSQLTSAFKNTGNVFYVSSTTTGAADAANMGRSPTSPFATLAYATAAATTPCLSGNGDTIYVMPGHAETIAVASGINMGTAAAGAAGCDGVTIIGMGNGSNRPTFSWSTTASTWLIAASNVVIKNILTIPSVDEVVSAFSVTGLWVNLDGVDVIPVTSKQFIQWLLTTAAASFLTIKNCFHRQSAAAAATQVWIQLVGTTSTRIIDNDIDILAAASASSICINGSTAVVDCEIARNLIRWRGASITSPISCVTTSTGIVTDNRLGVTSTSGTIDNMITGDTMFKFNNLAIDVAGTASGILSPAVGTYT